MDTNRKSFDIVNGPSRDTLFDACKYAYDSRNTVLVDFEIAVGHTLPQSNPESAYIPMKIKNIIIGGILHEDGSGVNLNLYGWCDADLEILKYQYAPRWKHYKFKCYYDSKHRKGKITFVL